jgi:acyl-coenzyme A synthetase/AMP-(fatty) acid ligase
MDFVAVQNRYAITQVAATAFTLTRVLESAPSVSGLPLSKATVTFAGAALPEAIWRKAARLFTGPVLSHYGSTEAGPAAFGDVSLIDRYPDAVGRLLPWNRVEAVDDNDRPLPAGEQGILRVRGPGMAHRYADDPAASAAAFRDGWFYPGDVGAVTIDGILRVAGRSDDLLNLGGQKIAPSTLEGVLTALPNVRDVAAAAMREPNGLPSIGVGVVADTPLDVQSMTARCREVMSTQIPVHVVQIDAIPRNEAGKILRRELAASISSARAKIAIVP